MKVISGGQTGVDRAALDAARAAELETGGWCPRGGRAEDMPSGLRDLYPELQETASRDYRVRTKKNIADSDATLIITSPDTHSPGTELTARLARELGKPLLIISSTPEEAERARSWLQEIQPQILNVAGPRESSQPGIYQEAYSLLELIF